MNGEVTSSQCEQAIGIPIDIWMIRDISDAGYILSIRQFSNEKVYKIIGRMN